MKLLPLLLTACLLVSCATSPIPAPVRPAVSTEEVSNEKLVQLMQSDWELLAGNKVSDEERQEVIRRYNKNLLLYLRRLRYDAFRTDEPMKLRPNLRVVLAGWETKGHLTDIYDDLIPSVDVTTSVLEEHNRFHGLGVPVVGVIPAENVGKSEHQFSIRTRGAVSNLTALLHVAPDGKTELNLIRRSTTEVYRLGCYQYGLAADFSAPLDIYWQLTNPAKDRFLGLLRPQKLRDTTGLSCIDVYDPDKIPVILTHGLASSAETFANLVNRLQNAPDIRARYQFWYFNYPTGLSWVVTADEYRRSLAEARRLTDPHHRNRNWERMVVLGHSMGGLITHYSQCEEPWLMLRDEKIVDFSPYMSAKYIDEPLPFKEAEVFRTQYYFRPVQAGMVVYLATPHRGAPLAEYRIVEALTQLVSLPQNLLSEAVRIVTLQDDMVLLHPEQLTEWFTSVNQLSPDSYSIKGLYGLKVRSAPTLSVIGDQGEKIPRAETSDGIVPYWSSHISWGEETMVPSGHSVQDDPATAERLIKLLRGYK